jgi:hypothetical protein
MKIAVLSHSPPTLSFRIDNDTEGALVEVFGVQNVDDHLIDSLSGCVSRYGLSDGLRTWVHLQSFTVLSMQPIRPVGVSLRDIAVAAGEEDDATDWVKRFVDSKQITAKPIGKCPLKGHPKLYRLSEILEDSQKWLGWTNREKSRVELVLKAKEREPKPSDGK